MKHPMQLILLAFLICALCEAPAGAVDFKKGPPGHSASSAEELAVTVELLGERGAVYGRGKEIGISLIASRDAYVVVYNVDSEGYVHLLFPADGRPARVAGGKTHILPEPGSDSRWETGGKTGVEYIHALAVDERSRLDEDELYFLSKNERLSEEKRLRVDLDPFLAFNMIDEEIVRDADGDPPATDYTYFYINRRVDYLCAKCHSPEAVADPYGSECPEVRIERIAYADDPRYPYPQLYDIRYAREAEDEDARSAADDRGESDEEDGYDEYDDEDTKVYLSLSSGSYAHPWYSPWPYYGGSYFGWGLYPVWDPFWSSFYWNIWWSDYYWWPYYSSWYPSYPYWYYPCWSCDDYWYVQSTGGSRPIYGDRSATKLAIDYTATNTTLTRERSLVDSRLMKAKRREAAERIERSDLRRKAIDRDRDDRESVRRAPDRPTRDIDRATSRDKAARSRPPVRGVEPKAGKRSEERGRGTTDRRSADAKREDARRPASAPSDARVDRPERPSRDADRIAPAPARGPSRSSSTPYRGASGATRSNSGKTKSR